MVNAADDGSRLIAVEIKLGNCTYVLQVTELMIAVNIEFGNCGIVIFTAYDRSWLLAV